MALQIQLPNGEGARLEFEHRKHLVPILHKRLSGKAAVVTHTTIARIMKGEVKAPEEFIRGEAHCAADDNFSRETGRAVALAHMLQLDKPEADRPLSRWLTGKILQAYYNRRRKPTASNEGVK